MVALLHPRSCDRRLRLSVSPTPHAYAEHALPEQEQRRGFHSNVTLRNKDYAAVGEEGAASRTTEPNRDSAPGVTQTPGEKFSRNVSSSIKLGAPEFVTSSNAAAEGTGTCPPPISLVSNVALGRVEVMARMRPCSRDSTQHARPEPDFRYFSKAMALGSLANSIDAIRRHGRSLAGSFEPPELCTPSRRCTSSVIPT